MVSRRTQSPTSVYSDDDAADVKLSRSSSISSEDGTIDEEVASSFDRTSEGRKHVEKGNIVIAFTEDLKRLESYVPMLDNKNASIKLAAAQAEIKQLKAELREKERKIEDLQDDVKSRDGLAKSLAKVRRALE